MKTLLYRTGNPTLQGLTSQLKKLGIKIKRVTQANQAMAYVETNKKSEIIFTDATCAHWCEAHDYNLRQHITNLYESFLDRPQEITFETWLQAITAIRNAVHSLGHQKIVIVKDCLFEHVRPWDTPTARLQIQKIAPLVPLTTSAAQKCYLLTDHHTWTPGNTSPVKVKTAKEIEDIPTIHALDICTCCIAHSMRLLPGKEIEHTLSTLPDFKAFVLQKIISTERRWLNT